MFSATANGPVERMITQKFCQVGVCLSKVGISHLTTHDQDGNHVPRYTLFHLKENFSKTCIQVSGVLQWKYLEIHEYPFFICAAPCSLSNSHWKRQTSLFPRLGPAASGISWTNLKALQWVRKSTMSGPFKIQVTPQESLLFVQPVKFNFN